jgi:hypothetical protein
VKKLIVRITVLLVLAGTAFAGDPGTMPKPSLVGHFPWMATPVPGSPQYINSKGLLLDNSGNLVVAPAANPQGSTIFNSAIGVNVDSTGAVLISSTSQTIGNYTVATLPTPSAYLMAWVSDGASSTDCTTGLGSTKVLCYYNGSAWTSIGSGGGTGTVTVVGAGSLTSTAIMTGGGTTESQTPSATSTLDASGNLGIAGNFSLPAGGTICSADTGSPCATFGTNSISFNQPITSTATGPWINIPEAASAITPASGYDICDSDSTAHGITCSFNNDTASKLLRQSDRYGSSPAALLATKAAGADPTADNCVKWAAGGVLDDSGGACGGSGTITSYQFVNTPVGATGTGGAPAAGVMKWTAIRIPASTDVTFAHMDVYLQAGESSAHAHICLYDNAGDFGGTSNKVAEVSLTNPSSGWRIQAIDGGGTVTVHGGANGAWYHVAWMSDNGTTPTISMGVTAAQVVLPYAAATNVGSGLSDCPATATAPSKSITNGPTPNITLENW